MSERIPGRMIREVRKMNQATQGMTWKEVFMELLQEFRAFGCPYRRKEIPGIALGYDCTPLYFWNWMDDPETDRSEKGFLRVLGYAWRKHLEEEAEAASAGPAVSTPTGSRRAA